MHGTTNAKVSIQSSICTNVPVELRTHILFCVNDILMHARTTNEFLEAMQIHIIFCKKLMF